MNLTESNKLKVCAINPCPFRERLRERDCTRETEKESAPHMEFMQNYFKICLKVIEKSVTFSDAVMNAGRKLYERSEVFWGKKLSR